MRIHCLLHVEFEGPGLIGSWAISRGYSLTFTKFYLNEQLPAINDFDWLIIMGGPMGVYDVAQYPYLPAEKDFIKATIDNNKIVLGICLGAQLIASALGARVYPNQQKEIGWFNLDLTEPAAVSILQNIPPKFMAFHWHGDTFDLPSGATRFSSSTACLNQGFLFYEKVVGLQFHLEVGQTEIKNLIKHCSSELIPAEFVQTEAEIIQLTTEYANSAAVYLEEILEHLSSR